MPIELTCQCGRDLYLRDELAGKQIRCPDCQRTLTVPYASSTEPFRDEPLAVRPVPTPAPAYDAMNERSEERRPEPPPFPVEPPLSRTPLPTTGGGVNGGKVIGGVAMLVAGGVMLGVGGFGGCGKFPYILLVIGVITLVKGLLGSKDDD